LDLYDLEDILKELRELEANNKFHEGDIISKSSKTRVKRKSGKLKLIDYDVKFRGTRSREDDESIMLKFDI
jgi:hypothetical protein